MGTRFLRRDRFNSYRFDRFSWRRYPLEELRAFTGHTNDLRIEQSYSAQLNRRMEVAILSYLSRTRGLFADYGNATGSANFAQALTYRALNVTDTCRLIKVTRFIYIIEIFIFNHFHEIIFRISVIVKLKVCNRAFWPAVRGLVLKNFCRG